MSDWEDVPLASNDEDWADIDDAAVLEPEPTSQTESALRGAAQGATLGFADEMAGGVEALWEKAKGSPIEFAKLYEIARNQSRDNFKRAKDDNPKTYTAGELGGGVATALVPVGAGAMTAAKAAKLGLGVGGVAGLGNSEAEDAEGMLRDTAVGAGMGAAAGVGGQQIAKGASKLANKFSQDYAPTIAKMLPIGKKSNAPEIEAAAKALGTKATPGMVTASPSVQKLESSLHQAPTIGGWLTRRGTEPVSKAMGGATDDLLEGAATISPFESGEQVKKILAKEVEGKFAPSKKTFQDLAQYTKDINATPTSVKAVSRNIMNIPEVDTLDLPLAKQVVKALEKNPSVDQIKTLRSMVGKKAKSSLDGAESSAYWQMYAKLGKLEENTLKRGVISSARTKPEGDTIAKGMLDQLRGAKKGYSEQMGGLEDLAQASRLGKFGGPSGFVDKIDSIPSERLQEKLLPLEDVRLAKTMQNQFPEAFGGLKKARLRDLAEGTMQDSERLPGKFLQKTKGLNPEAEQMLFGDKAPKLQSLRTVNEALPDKVGPSGTQQAFQVQDMLNPVNQVKDLARYGAYKYSSSEKLAKLADFLKQQPKFQSLAEQNPKAFQAAVYDLSKRMSPKDAMPMAAGVDQEQENRIVSEDEAQQRFIEGN